MLRRIHRGLIARRNLLSKVIAPCIEQLESRQLLSSVPNGPFAMSATAVSATTVNLAFYDSATNEDGFVIQKALSANGTYSTVATLPAAAGSGTKVTYSDTTDVGATTYYYRAYAYSGPYQSSFATASVTTLPGSGQGVTIPNAPSGLTAAISSGQVVLNFTDNSTNETDFVVQRSTSATGPFTTIGSLTGDNATGPRSFTDGSGSPNTTYYYEVYAENGAGPSTPAGPVSITTPTAPSQNPGGAPNGPFGLTATAANSTTVNLSFYDSATNETGFVVQRATVQNGTYTTLATLPAANGSFTLVNYSDTTAQASTTYYYSVYAVNGPYQSGNTTASVTTPAGSVPVTIPTAPTAISAAISNSQVVVTFTDNSTNESDFVVERSTSATGVFASVGTVSGDSATGTKTFTDTSAAASTTYYYEVYAENSAGPSAVDGPSGAVTTPATPPPPTQNPGGPPNGPFGATATATGATSVNLSFYDSATNETGFVIQRSTSLNGTYTTVATLPPAAGSGTVVTYTDSTVSPSTTYYYNIYAINGVYQSGTTSTSATTPAPLTPPAAPSAVTATISANSVVVSFTDNSNNESDFVILRSTSATGTFMSVGKVTGDSATGTKSFTDTTAAASTTYYYEVYAENAAGPSATVAAAAAVTTPAPPTIPVAPTNVTVAMSGSNVVVTFTDNSTNETDFVVQRSTSATGPWTTLGTVVGDAVTGTKTFSDTTAANSTTYYYQVYAENSAGPSTAAVSPSITTPANIATNPGGPPNGPYGITASPLNSSSVEVQWIDSADNETGFVITRSSSASGPFTQIGTASYSPGTRVKLSFIDVAVQPQTTYYYEVYAVNGPFASGIDGPASATTPAVSTNPQPTGPWVPYATLIGQSNEVSDFPSINGTGITIAVVDRGVDTSAPGLSPSKVIGGYNFRDNNTTLLDDYGHGTGVAGIIAASGYTYNGAYNQGVAYDASLVVCKQESSANIKSALDWIIANAEQFDIQVVNLTDFVTDVLPGAFNPSVYQPELQTLYNMGIFVATPAGNGFASNPGAVIGLPASSPYVCAVGGVGQDGSFWGDSLRGPGLDVLGPDSNVTMPYYVKNPNATGYDQFDDNYTGTGQIVDYATGTSWATAYVSGTAALIKQVNPKITPAEILSILQQTGTPTLDPVNNVYVPLINVDKAVAMAEQLYGPNGTSKP